MNYAHWTELVECKLWEPLATGPDTFDCWGLVFYVYQTHLGITLKKRMGCNPTNVRQAAAAYAREARSGEWLRLEKPEELCVVSISRTPNQCTHVGLYTELDGGLIVHCAESAGGVQMNTKSELIQHGYPCLKFHRYHKYNG